MMRELNRERDTVLEILEQMQDSHGCISGKAMQELSELMNMTVSDIYGIATFYSFLSVKPQGSYVIRVCKSLPCYLKSAEVIAEAVEKELGITQGETTPDGQFTFELANCIGLCDHAPAMLINQDPHLDLTPEKIKKILL